MTTSAQARSPIASSVHPYTLLRTEQFVLTSAEGHAYEISVATPGVAAPASGYPVIYLLDPSRGFATLVETLQNRESYVGPAVVVGIGYPPGAPDGERQRDLTTKPDLASLPEALGQPTGPMGEADKFLQFIESRVKPAVGAKVSIDPRRQGLFGHSYGGLFVLHALFTRPDYFQTYVAASPSIWWNREALLAEARRFKAGLKADGTKRRLLITVGADEAALQAQDIALLRAATKPTELAETLRQNEAFLKLVGMVSNSENLSALLSETESESLEVRFVPFPEENHDSVIPAYLSRGASFMLGPR